MSHSEESMPVTSLLLPLESPSSPSMSAKFNVEYFARDHKLTKKEKREANLFPEKQVRELKTERIEDQKVVDKALLVEIKKTPLLKQYLAASFSLKNGDRPHLLKF